VLGEAEEEEDEDEGRHANTEEPPCLRDNQENRLPFLVLQTLPRQVRGSDCCVGVLVEERGNGAFGIRRTAPLAPIFAPKFIIEQSPTIFLSPTRN
jgi:hypothetical protein